MSRRRLLLAESNNVGDDMYRSYFFVEALRDGMTAKFTESGLQYSIDGCRTWVSLSANTASPAIKAGDKIFFRGSMSPSSSSIGSFSVTKQCNVGGNIMSLLFADDFIGQEDLSGYEFVFSSLFGLQPIVDASQLRLPATMLSYGSYAGMFYNCTSLTTAPALPSTTLAEQCYLCMFQLCTALTTPPELAATILEKQCYDAMFDGCTSLAVAPELPATILAESCYNWMFRNCSALTTAPELPATTLASHCYSGMFNGCASLATAPTELPATTLAERCYLAMFGNCTSLTTAPELPATKLANNCYNQMFYSCSNLSYIKMLATDISALNCLYRWVSGVASNGTFVKDTNMTSLPTGTDGIPSGWSVQNA